MSVDTGWADECCRLRFRPVPERSRPVAENLRPFAEAAPSTRVLIVDDNLALAENIAEILGFEGYETDVAASAEDALPKAMADGLAVIVTDFKLPGIDGAELVERVRLSGKAIHCIMISAYTDDATMDRAQRAGAHFIAKPVDLVALAQHIRTIGAERLL